LRGIKVGREMAKYKVHCLVTFFLLTLPTVTPYLRGDGIGYYSYIASLVIDGDLYFENEFRHADSWHYRNYFDERGNLRLHNYTRTGYVDNKFSVGPSILWAPFFLMAHAFVKLQNALLRADIQVSPYPPDGFSLPYRYLCALGTAFYGFLGLVLAFTIAKAVTDEWSAFWATVGIWFASALPVYMYFLPFMSHAHSAFVCSLLVWYWWRTYPSRVGESENTPTHLYAAWFLLGLLTGFAFTTYYVNLLLAIFILADFVEIWGNRLGRHKGLPLPLLAMFYGFGLFLGWLPTGIIKWVLYGSPFQLGYGDPWWFHDPRLLKVLFSSEHGLWSWTPIIFFACVGFIPLIRRNPTLGWRCLLTFLVFWYFIASYDDWHGQSSFSNRFFVSLTPLFVCGLAAFLAWVREQKRAMALRFVPALIAVLVLWNIGFIFQWGTGLINKRGPISWSKMVHQQFTVVPFEMARTMRLFFTDRTALVKMIEARDFEEAKHYRIRR